MDTVRNLLASRLKLLRKSKGLRQTDLAETLGCEINTISRYETGAITPSIEQLLRLAQALGVSPMEILPPQDPNTQRVLKLRQYITEKVLQMESRENLEQLAHVTETLLSKSIHPEK